MERPKVLIVDDDTRILELLKQFFERNEFEVVTSESAEDAEGIMSMHDIDLLILDVMLPGVTGFEFAERIKSSPNQTPIILLTALGDADDRVRGLETGADDYLTKPFDPRELILRAKNLLELYKSNISKESEDVMRFGDCEYNFQTKKLTMSSEDVILSSTEQKLLEYLLLNKGKAVTRETLSGVMGGLSDRSIDVQIARLRQKIEPDSLAPKYLLTIRHEGYGIFF
ncbi:MAG: response regulator transcription factor [Rickettsiaceae bacterium]|nr:response regulator transcription factor [Rickettsiaceae bacterium]